MAVKILTVSLFLSVLLAGTPLAAQPISRQEVMAAIGTLERDVTGPGAMQAAVTITRFGKESDAVTLIVGPETLPWVRTDVSEAQARIRALVMAAYFGGDIKSQLQKGRPGDDPYRGWLAAIRAYRQIQRQEPGMVIPELEVLARQRRDGTLRQRADELLKRQRGDKAPAPDDYI